MPALSVPLLLLAAAGVGIAHSVLPDHWVPLAVIARTNRWTLAHTARISFLASVGHVGVSLLLGVLLAIAGLALSDSIIAYEGQIVGGILVLTGLGFLVWALARPARDHGHAHSYAQEGDDPPDAAGEHAHGHVHGVSDAHAHEHSHAREQAHTVAAGDPRGAAIAPAVADDDRPAPGAGQAQEPGVTPSGRWLGEIAVPFGVAASPDLTILPVFLAAAAVGVGAAVGALVVFAVATILTFVVLTVAATAGGYQVQWPWLDRNGHVVSAVVLLVVGGLVLVGV